MLEAAGFEALLGWLGDNRDAAGERYELLRIRLHRLFALRGHASPDALADETLDRVARRLAAGGKVRTADPAAFVLGVARNVSREEWRRPRRDEPLEEDLPHQATEEEADDGTLHRALAGCLQRLAAERREVVLAYYQGQGGSQIAERLRLAERLGMGMNALRIRVHRIRQELEDCLRSEMERRAAPREGRGIS